MKFKKKGITGRWKRKQGVAPCYLSLAVALKNAKYDFKAQISLFASKIISHGLPAH